MQAKKLSAKKILQVIQGTLEDAKAKDIVMLDVSKISDFTDCMVVASGTSNRHVTSAADKVVDKLRELGLRPIGTEGHKTGDWVLVDFGDVVVHVMREQVRPERAFLTREPGAGRMGHGQARARQQTGLSNLRSNDDRDSPTMSRGHHVERAEQAAHLRHPNVDHPPGVRLGQERQLLDAHEAFVEAPLGSNGPGV